uniref:RagB/SusD family nutrient uptake outer membrane protein n=1 Tax=Prevotella sp. TaxID=59823 RepID=UPI00402738AD
MKKSIYFSFILAATLATTSCDLDAPTKSTIKEDIVFSTEELADAAIMGIHQSFGETNSYRGRFVPYYGTNTDCEIFNNYGGVSDPTTDKEASLACYSTSSTNTYMNTSNNAWAKLYEAIERANKAISAMEKNADIEGDAGLGQLYGEILTLRSFIYFDLVKAWGDVPYRFEPVTSETLYLPKTDRVTVLKKVMEDLETAEKYLGWPNENKYTVSTERASKSFAKGLRARIALFLAGKSEWSNEGLRYNLTDESERKAMYTIARDECVSIINQHCNQLGATFDENFRNLCKEDVTAGKESIFEIPFSDGRGRVLYTWGGKHKTTDPWTGLAKGGVNGPTPTLWYDFDKDDVRRNITCLPYTWDNGEKTISGASGGGWSFGKLRFEWMSRKVTSTNDDGINYQVIRYADIYLMAAEAENALNGPANAKQYLKPILDRAYPADKANSILAAASSQESFQSTIEDQRKFEFAGEGLRKLDLMRWGKLSSTLAETKEKMTELSNRTGRYANYPKKLYYNEGLGAANTDADTYEVYGLEEGQTDDEGKALYSSSSNWFSYREHVDGEKDSDKKSIDDNNNKIDKYLQYLYVNDPDQKMFWPIWKVFIDSSNGLLKNDYDY